MRATLIDRYLVKRILVMFAFVACILVLALSLERLLRLVDEVTTSGAPILQAFLLLFYLQPHYLGLTIPAALFLSVILTVRRLHEQSEMVIFYASGRSLFRTLLPILALAGALAGVLLFLVSIAQPYSRYAFRAEYHTVRQTQQQVQLRPHAFQRLGERLVLRIEAVEGENPATIRGFFSEETAKHGSRTTISADSATVTMLPGQPVSLQLHDGSIIKHNAQGKAQFIAFNDYAWSPEIEPAKAYGLRGQDKRELNLLELVHGGIAGVTLGATDKERIAELHLRLVQVASVPLLVMLAIPLALIGGNRGGRAYGLGVGLVVLVLYQKILGFGQALAASGKLSPFVSLWGPWLLLLIAALLLLAYRNYFPKSATLFSTKHPPL